MFFLILIGSLPEKGYLALGDNYAMSSDSRTLGPVPQDNLEGTTLIILWPPLYCDSCEELSSLNTNGYRTKNPGRQSTVSR